MFHPSKYLGMRSSATEHLVEKLAASFSFYLCILTREVGSGGISTPLNNGLVLCTKDLILASSGVWKLKSRGITLSSQQDMIRTTDSQSWHQPFLFRDRLSRLCTILWSRQLCALLQPVFSWWEFLCSPTTTGRELLRNTICTIAWDHIFST
jgi:hypothetical protein